MRPFYLSESLRPYLVIIAGSILLLAYGFFTNSSAIGALFGAAAASIDIRVNLVFLVGILLIYNLRKPYIAIAAAVTFAILYQLYIVEVSRRWQVLGLDKPAYVQFSRIYGGVLLLSFLGLCHFTLRKLRGISTNA